MVQPDSTSQKLWKQKFDFPFIRFPWTHAFPCSSKLHSFSHFPFQPQKQELYKCRLNEELDFEIVHRKFGVGEWGVGDERCVLCLLWNSRLNWNFNFRQWSRQLRFSLSFSNLRRSFCYVSVIKNISTMQKAFIYFSVLPSAKLNMRRRWRKKLLFIAW